MITRRVIERLENGNVTDEILQEYADPESQKYETMVEEIRKELNLLPFGLTDLTICLTRRGWSGASCVRTAGMERNKKQG